MTGSVVDAVHADLDARRVVGIGQYGTELRPHNGRDALRDAYEEALDLACYLRQALMERDLDQPPEGRSDLDQPDAPPCVGQLQCGCGEWLGSSVAAICPQCGTMVYRLDQGKLLDQSGQSLRDAGGAVGVPEVLEGAAGEVPPNETVHG